MPHTNATAEAIQEMVRFFMPRCSDPSTLRELDSMASDDQQWRYAHALFRRIRAKTLRADGAKNNLLQHQYSFEEIFRQDALQYVGALRSGLQGVSRPIRR